MWGSVHNHETHAHAHVHTHTELQMLSRAYQHAPNKNSGISLTSFDFNYNRGLYMMRDFLSQQHSYCRCSPEQDGRTLIGMNPVSVQGLGRRLAVGWSWHGRVAVHCNGWRQCRDRCGGDGGWSAGTCENTR